MAGKSTGIAKMAGKIFGDGSVDADGNIYFTDVLGNVAQFDAKGNSYFIYFINLICIFMIQWYIYT